VASSKREKELARQRAERQAARRAAAERKRRQRNAIVASVVAAVLLIGVGTTAVLALTGGDETPSTLTADPTPVPEPSEQPPSEQPSAEPSVSAEPAAPPPPPAEPTGVTCTYTPSGEPARPVQPPPTTPEGLDQPLVATIATDRGDLRIDLAGDKAPCTVNSLRSLAEQDYFSDTPCHRLTTSGIFVLQCGDPTGTGRGGPGYQFADENLEGGTYPRGTVAMANAGPGTNGSQFFLVYKDSQLPPSYTPFGTITEGLEVLDTVAAAGAAPAGPGGNTAPNLPVQIKTVTVAPRG
jgi:peptidyl-prolyl cis-trans isomerase B (cyclophilin B)